MSINAPVSNPAGAYGLTASAPATGVNAVAANAISAGEVVALSTSPGYVIRNLVATTAGLQCGVALNTAGAGKSVTVATGGWVTVNKGTASLTAGNLVKADPTVSGAVGLASDATVVSQASNLNGIIGKVVADASAAATTVAIFLGVAL